MLTGGATQFDLYLELGSVTEYSEGEVYFDCVKIERLEELPEGAEAAVINGGGGLSADAYIINFMCFIGRFYCFQKRRREKTGGCKGSRA